MPATEIQEHIKDIDNTGKVEKTDLLEGLKNLQAQDIINSLNNIENKNAIKSLIEKPVQEAIKGLETKEFKNLTLDQKDLLVLSAWIKDPNINLTSENYNKKAESELIMIFKGYSIDIKKRLVDVKESVGKPETKFYEKNISNSILDIKDMVSGNSDIPSQYTQQIINAIDNVKKGEKIRIIGCTDGSPIDTPNAIEKNKKQFNEVLEKYKTAGGSCPSYDELLKSPQDPQNTILGYARAMEGILSLKLTPEQLKKVEIGNKLGKNINDPKERGFDIDIEYTERVEETIHTSVYKNVYRMLGEVKQENIGRDRSNYRENPNQPYGYTISNLNFSTGEIFAKTYQDVYNGAKDIVGNNPYLENKIMLKTSDYLNHLINVCGGKYQNGTRSANSISDRMYFLIKAIKPKTEGGFISEAEFRQLTEEGDLSILEKKQLPDSGQTVGEYIKNLNITGVYKQAGPTYRYNVPDNNPLKNHPLEREIGENDYILLGLYFQMKASIKQA